MLLKFFKNNWVFAGDYTRFKSDLYIDKDDMVINFYNDFVYYKRFSLNPKNVVKNSYEEILRLIKNEN